MYGKRQTGNTNILGASFLDYSPVLATNYTTGDLSALHLENGAAVLEGLMSPVCATHPHRSTPRSMMRLPLGLASAPRSNANRYCILVGPGSSSRRISARLVSEATIFQLGTTAVVVHPRALSHAKPSFPSRETYAALISGDVRTANVTYDTICTKCFPRSVA